MTEKINQIKFPNSIVLHGNFTKSSKIDNKLLTREYFSFFQYNSNSRENYKKNHSKNLINQTKIDLALYEKHFFLFPLTEDIKSPFENLSTNPNFSFISIFFDELIDNNLLNTSIIILQTIKDHFWRFKQRASWDNIQTLISLQ